MGTGLLPAATSCETRASYSSLVKEKARRNLETMILRSRIIYALESNCPLCIVLHTDWGSMTDGGSGRNAVTRALLRPLELHLEPLKSHLTTPVTPATCTTQPHCHKSPLRPASEVGFSPRHTCLLLSIPCARRR